MFNKSRNCGALAMHPELIKAHLRMRGFSLSRLARELRVSTANVGHVVHGRHKSIRIARRICAITGISAREAWENRYQELLIPERGELNKLSAP